jgi:hypothetical protein
MDGESGQEASCLSFLVDATEDCLAGRWIIRIAGEKNFRKFLTPTSPPPRNKCA